MCVFFFCNVGHHAYSLVPNLGRLYVEPCPGYILSSWFLKDFVPPLTPYGDEQYSLWTVLGHQTNGHFVNGVCVCVRASTPIGQCDRCWTAIVMDFNACWGALPRPNCNVRKALNGRQCNRGMEMRVVVEEVSWDESSGGRRIMRWE